MLLYLAIILYCTCLFVLYLQKKYIEIYIAVYALGIIILGIHNLLKKELTFHPLSWSDSSLQSSAMVPCLLFPALGWSHLHVSHVHTIHVIPGFHTRFFVGGGKSIISNILCGVYYPYRGVWGHAPLGNFEI